MAQDNSSSSSVAQRLDAPGTARGRSHKNIRDGVIDERRPTEDHFQLLESRGNIWDPITEPVIKEMEVKEKQISTCKHQSMAKWCA